MLDGIRPFFSIAVDAVHLVRTMGNVDQEALGIPALGPELCTPNDLSLDHHRLRIDVEKTRFVCQYQLALVRIESLLLGNESRMSNKLIVS